MMTLPLIDRRYPLATTVSDALLAKREMGPEAVYLGGGTALQLGWSDGQVPPPLIDVAALRRPSPAELDQDHLHLCAFAPTCWSSASSTRYRWRWRQSPHSKCVGWARSAVT